MKCEGPAQIHYREDHVVAEVLYSSRCPLDTFLLFVWDASWTRP
jgi:hypothetical protein